MPIVSVSIHENLLRELDQIQTELGFSGRSEVFRAGARMLIQDTRSKQSLEGIHGGVLIVLHSADMEQAISQAKHDFEDIIDTQVHNHSVEGKCLDIFILHGDAPRLVDFERRVSAFDEVDYIRLITPY
jgi:CopG family nickel-responsive transcriptional regulator